MTHTANHTHIFQLCTKLSVFWREVFDAIRELFQQDIPQDPTVVILGTILDLKAWTRGLRNTFEWITYSSLEVYTQQTAETSPSHITMHGSTVSGSCVFYVLYISYQTSGLLLFFNLHSYFWGCIIGCGSGGQRGSSTNQKVDGSCSLHVKVPLDQILTPNAVSLVCVNG